jgi:ferrochelatase
LKRLAVVLFNLGGPDAPKAVRPFLFNLFRDPAIIGAPGLVRYPLAALIAARRERAARANYALMGGASPIRAATEAQARALEDALRGELPDYESRAFVAMRYWAPLTEAAAKAVAAFGPDEIVLLPLYPQYSTTTTASSLAAWRAAYAGEGRTRTICCYPDAEDLVSAHARLIAATAEAAGADGQGVRLLFSAHGLPEKVIAAGDPYAAQVAATANAIAARLPAFRDWTICYQSRVGPLRWIGPSTEAEIRRAGKDGKGVLIAPIAFVSEHVETLVELDHEYGQVAAEAGCAPYLRVPALGADAGFVAGLASAVSGALAREAGTGPAGPWRCPAAYPGCGARRAA